MPLRFAPVESRAVKGPRMALPAGCGSAGPFHWLAGFRRPPLVILQMTSDFFLPSLFRARLHGHIPAAERSLCRRCGPLSRCLNEALPRLLAMPESERNRAALHE